MPSVCRCARKRNSLSRPRLPLWIPVSTVVPGYFAALQSLLLNGDCGQNRGTVKRHNATRRVYPLTLL